MTNRERHNKPDQPANDDEQDTQVQREHHKPDHGKDDREVRNEQAKKPSHD